MSNEDKKKDTSWFSVLLFAVLIIVGYWGWQHYKKAPEKQEETIERTLAAAPLIESEAEVVKDYIGYVTPVHDVSVRPYINGFINDIRVQGGAEVKAGDVMVIIDQAEYKAQLDAAKANVARAQATFDNSDVYYQRMQKAGQRAISKTELDNAKAAFLSAKAALEQAKAAEAEAQVNYDYTVIKATIDGMVGDVPLSKGDYVSPETVLLTVIQYNPIRVVFSITDKDYLDEAGREKMFAGENIRLKLADGKIYGQSGIFRYADNRIDKSTNSIAIYADFANPDKLLVAGAYVDVLVEKKYRGMVVRKDLVYIEPDGSYIYVAENGEVRKTAVDVLSEYGNNNYILKNKFKPGDLIVLDKMGAGDDGRKFKIVMEGAASAGEKH